MAASRTKLESGYSPSFEKYINGRASSYPIRRPSYVEHRVTHFDLCMSPHLSRTFLVSIGTASLGTCIYQL